MIPRICLIGSSHLAAVKLGWDKCPSLAFRPTWFGAARDGLKYLYADGHMLRSSNEHVSERLSLTSGGDGSIDVRGYEAFVIVGGGLAYSRVAKAHHRFRTLDHSLSPAPRYMMSKRAFEVLIEDQIDRSIALFVARLLRGLTKAPIVVLADPLPAFKATTHPSEGVLWSGLLQTGDGETILRNFDEALSKAVTDAGALLLSRPNKGMKGRIFYDDKMLDGRELGGREVQYPEEEYGHMGIPYGMAALQEISDGVASLL